MLDLELTSTARAHAFAPVVTVSTPTSSAPSGDESPAAYWRARFARAADEREASELVKQAREELRRIRRRSFPAIAYDTADELGDLVVRDGEGVDALGVAIALRCTPTFVRRQRIVRGRDPEYGRVVDVELSARSLRDAGLSIRQVSAVLGVPRSTLHERLARAA